LGGFELGLLPGDEKVASLGKRERVLLTYLALSPKGSQPRRKLAALLWGDATDETLLDNLRACVWKLRKALGDTEHSVIASEGEDIVLDAAAFDVDALAFRRLAAQSDRTGLDAAANLYSGEFLDGLDIGNEEFESWRRAEATRYRDQAVDVLNRLMTLLVECGETERAVETGLKILRLEPLHEAAIRRLMRLYGGSGRRGAAVQLYRTLADALRTELGAQPEAETRAVFAEIARGGEDLTSDASTADAGRPALSTSTARPSDASREPPPAQQHAPVIGASRQAKMGVLGWILAGGLAAAVIAIFLFQQFAPPAGRATASAGAITIAVLPFTNLSSDAEQEFFSDGITEEITAALAKIKDLPVVARTSAYQFKDERKDLRAIGQALNATHLIEGSVRKEGNRVRITAQLIQAHDGVHVWTESYDRELTGVFAIQEEIATAIAGALRVPLGLAPGKQLVSNRDIDPESYQQYLGARALIRTLVNQPGAAERRIAAIKELEQIVARYPRYAPAWAQLALGYYRRFNIGLGISKEERRRAKEEWLPKSEAAARRAIEVDANLADGYAILGTTVLASRRDLVQAEALYSKALALDPFHPEAQHYYALLLGAVGRVKEALVMRKQLIVIEPIIFVYNQNIEELLWISGQADGAQMDRLRAATRRGGPALAMLARIYAEQGRYTEAVDTLMAIPPQRYGKEKVDAAVSLLRTAPAAAISPQNLPRLALNLEFVYLHVGAPERVLEPFEDVIAEGNFPAGDMVWLWHPSYAPARKTDRFKTFARKAGLVDYWRAKGWPAFCHPLGTNDFACE